MKRKLFSLALAAALAASLAGCAMSTPATVGSIGDVEIPAGLYLLMQYNDYSAASSAATLGEDETANDVKAVLKAEATGTIGEEEVTATGKEYLARLTLRDLEYYAAVETAFAGQGAGLDADELAEIQSRADSLWESNGEVYAANGIGKETLATYLETAQKAQKLLEGKYGADGTDPVSDDEYKAYLADECRYVDSIEFPVFDYSTYTMADSDQLEVIRKLAEQCADDLNDLDLPEGTAEETREALLPTAQKYLADAMDTMNVDFDPDDAQYYYGSGLLTDDDLATYDDDEGANKLTDAVDEGGWAVVDMTTSILVVRRIDPLKGGALEDLVANYGLLNEVKGEAMQAELYAQGAALPHALKQSAMNTYKPENIKRTV